MKFVFLGLLIAGIVTPGVYGGNPTMTMELRDYGLAAPSDASCAGVTSAGWYIDRAYDATCFGRQVYCTSSATYDASHSPSFATCDNNEVFIADGDFDCHSTSSSVAQSACSVNVICNQDSIGIIVDHAAIWDQTEADLQIGSYDCPFSYSSSDEYYMTTKSILDSEWSDCGIDRWLMEDPTRGDGYSIVYNFQVKRWAFRSSLELNVTEEREEEEHDGVVVTREKCFMVDAYCYYNADGTVTSSFVPSSANTLTESDTSQLTFSLEPVTCGTTTAIDTQVVYVNDAVCFRANIDTDWHTNIRMNINRCYATNYNGDVYPLGNRSATTQSSIDSTFSFDCYDSFDLYHEYFSFNAFRFQNDTFGAMNNIESYVQTIHITCDVVACEADDKTSTDCYTLCPTSARKRRDVSESIMGKYTHDTVHAQAFVLPERKNYFNTDSFSNNMFSMLMFGTGCVLAIAVIGLLVTLNKMKKEVKYGVLPQDVRKA